MRKDCDFLQLHFGGAQLTTAAWEWENQSLVCIAIYWIYCTDLHRLISLPSELWAPEWREQEVDSGRSGMQRIYREARWKHEGLVLSEQVMIGHLDIFIIFSLSTFFKALEMSAGSWKCFDALTTLTPHLWIPATWILPYSDISSHLLNSLWRVHRRKLSRTLLSWTYHAVQWCAVQKYVEFLQLLPQMM